MSRPVYFIPVMIHVEASSREDARERLWTALDAGGSANMPITLNGVEACYITVPESEDDLQTWPKWVETIRNEGDVPQYDLTDNFL